MHNQEFERKMKFMMEQQAQVVAEQERHRLWKVEIEDLLTRLARVTKEGFKDVNAKINALVDAQIRMEDEQRKTDEQLRLTSEAQRKTDEQLRLTSEAQRTTEKTLDRYLRSKFSGGTNN